MITPLKKLMAEKNYSVRDVSELTGYGIRMIKYYRSGERVTPIIILKALELEPKKETNKITRGEFIELLEELNLTVERVATLLVRHLDRVKNMADKTKDEFARIAITQKEVEVLRERA